MIPGVREPEGYPSVEPRGLLGLEGTDSMHSRRWSVTDDGRPAHPGGVSPGPVEELASDLQARLEATGGFAKRPSGGIIWKRSPNSRLGRKRKNIFLVDERPGSDFNDKLCERPGDGEAVRDAIRSMLHKPVDCGPEPPMLVADLVDVPPMDYGEVNPETRTLAVCNGEQRAWSPACVRVLPTDQI